jgi:UDP-N-acetylmuramoylalanine--D-glutamate ligase
VKRSFFKGKKVVVMGLGRFGGGVDAVKLACDQGAKVLVTDSAGEDQLRQSIEQLQGYEGIEYHLGAHRREDFEQADVVIVNPAVRFDNEYVEAARRKGKFVTTAINIFFQLFQATIIGITGANGKSTTAALTAHLLASVKIQEHLAKRKENKSQQDVVYKNVWLSGNIGNRPLLGLLDKIDKDDLVVLELSSFQSEHLGQIRNGPRVALLTNLTPNHLDRHGTFQAYCAAKENIFKYQKLDGQTPAVSVFNAEDKIANNWYDKYSKEKGRVCIKYSVADVSDQIRKAFGLAGRANLSNLAGAIAVAKHFGVDDEAIKNCLPEFKALEHRLELAAEIGGVQWYNDSIATTPQSTMAALEAFGKPVVLIAGGYDKGLDFDEIGEIIASRTKAVVLIGQTAKKIKKAIEKKMAAENSEKNIEIEFAATLEEAVNMSNRLAESGDVVLLSPACASYDMFDNFEHRGREFVSLVRKLNG